MTHDAMFYAGSQVTSSSVTEGGGRKKRKKKNKREKILYSIKDSMRQTGYMGERDSSVVRSSDS